MMFTKITHALLGLCLLCLCVSLQAQPQRSKSAPKSERILMVGQLQSSTTATPLSFATISVFTQKDSTLVEGALTDDAGKFSMQVPPGEYYAVVQFIGFSDKTIPDVIVKKGQKRLDLGTIALSEEAVAMDEIEVTAERSQMTLKLDRKVFNVGKDLTNAGATAADILDNVPSITVDVEGNVSLRGSQNVRILINGKPSGLVGVGDVEALRRMQGDIIDRVELITNPSARYEAEGEAGIINIILKKNQKGGLNGSISVNTGYPHNHGASYSLNYRKNDFNLFSNFGMQYRWAPGGGFTNQTFLDDNGAFELARRIDRDQDRGRLGGNIQLGVDWLLDDFNTITASTLYRASRGDNLTDITYTDLDELGNILSIDTRDNDEIEDEQNIEAALTYRRTFEEKDREFSFDFRYILDDETETADYLEQGDSFESARIERSVITEDESNVLIQADYVHPFGETMKLEGGLRAALRKINNAFNWEEQNDNGEFVVFPGFDDELEYTEDVYAAYLIGAAEFGKIGIQAGVRSEYSDITAALLETDVRNDQNYLNFFPSASISYQLTENDQLQTSYSRRISRPSFRLLLPFSNFGDRFNIYNGNPNLRPEFTDSYELGYLRYLPKGSIMAGIFYRHTTDVIERLTITQGDGTTLRTPFNLSTRDAVGIEMNLSFDLFKWWKLNGDLNFFRAITEGQAEGQDLSADTFIWTGRMNSNFKFGKKVDMQVGFNYRGPQETTQGEREAVYSLNIGMSIDILNGKGQLNISGRDVFNTRIRRSVIDLPDLQTDSEFQWRRTQGVVVAFTYRLNQDRKRRGKGKGSKQYRDQRSSGDGF
ncbi:MAG: outer membrane beta-barrel family protein [Bacteroidota bacterium]